MSSKLIHFEVEMKPAGKARARGGKFGFYTPAKTVKAEKQIKTVCLAAMAAKKMKAFKKGEPLAVQIEAFYEIPKSASKKNKALMQGNVTPAVTKPDLDNVAKLILDSLNGVAYHDDSQIVTLLIHKSYDIRPRVKVVIGNISEIWQIRIKRDEYEGNRSARNNLQRCTRRI